MIANAILNLATQIPPANGRVAAAPFGNLASRSAPPEDTVSLSPSARQWDALFGSDGSDANDPWATFEDVFNLNGRSVGRLFGLENRADPTVLKETRARVGQLLESGMVGYQVRELPNGQRYLSFLSTEIAPGGPIGRAYPPGDPRARLYP